MINGVPKGNYYMNNNNSVQSPGIDRNQSAVADRYSQFLKKLIVAPQQQYIIQQQQQQQHEQ